MMVMWYASVAVWYDRRRSRLCNASINRKYDMMVMWYASVAVWYDRRRSRLCNASINRKYDID